MTITIKKETQEIIELQTPAYFKDNFCIYKVDEDVIVDVRETQITVWKKSSYCFDDLLSKAIIKTPATDAEFINTYNKLMSNISPFVNNAKCITQQA